MAQINRIPSGYLDLIGAETGGKNPPVTEEALTLALDMTPMYLAQTMVGFTKTQAMSAAAQIVEVFVPDDEVWLLRAIGVRTTLQAADSEAWEFGVRNFPRRTETSLLAPLSTIGVTPVLSGAAPFSGQGHSYAETLGRPIPLSHGMSITAINRNWTGATRTSRVDYLLSVLRG